MRRVLAACLVATAWLGACGSGTNSSDNATDDSSAPATGELEYFKPTYLPAGYAIKSTDVQDGRESEGATWTAQLGRAAGAKKYKDLVTVIVEKSNPEDDSDGSGYQPVDVNGHAGKQADNEITGAIVTWEQDGLSAAVVAPPGKHDDALGVARALRIDADVAKTHLDALPSGLEKIAEWGSSGGFARKRYSITTEATDAKGSIDSVRIDVAVLPTDFPVSLLGFGHELDASTEVRNHAAYVFRAAHDIGGRTFEQFIVSWGERTDLVVNVSGSVPVDELRAVAKGLKKEPEAQWRTDVKAK